MKVGELVVTNPKLEGVDWDEIALVATITSSSKRMTGFRYSVDDFEPFTPKGFDTLNTLKELRLAMAETEGRAWVQALVHLTRATSKINMTFEYDDETRWTRKAVSLDSTEYAMSIKPPSVEDMRGIKMTQSSELIAKFGELVMTDAALEDVDWDEIALVSTIMPSCRDMTGYRYSGDSFEAFAPSDFAPLRLLRKLNPVMAEIEGRAWVRVLIHLTRATSKLNMTFEYDDEKRWAAKVMSLDMTEHAMSIKPSLFESADAPVKQTAVKSEAPPLAKKEDIPLSKKDILAAHIASRGALSLADYEPYPEYTDGSVWGGTDDAQLDRINTALFEAGYYKRFDNAVTCLRDEHFPEGHDILFDAAVEARNAK